MWSTSWILIRWGLDDEELQPLGFAALRYLLGAGFLLAWVLSRPATRRQLAALDRPTLARAAGLGVVLYALTQGAQFVAIDRQPAATTSLVLSATPLLVALLAGRALAEAPSPRQVTGGVLVIAGAALYFSGSLSGTLVGMVAAFVGLGANSLGALLGRSLNRDAIVSAVVVTALSMSVGAVALAAASLIAEGWLTVSGRAWAIIAWLALVNTALAFTWWNMSLRRLSATESAGINNTMLLQIAVLAWWLLDENPGWIGLAGIAVVSCGVLLTQADRRTRFA